jgi:FkbM family methyltransferase
LHTALSLVLRRDFGTLRRQWHRYTAPRRLRASAGRAFVHRDLGFPAVCHPDWPDSVDQFLGTHGDHWEFELMRRWLRPEDTMIDVGANLGLYTFAAAAVVGSTGKVIAVEAAPFVAGKLEAAVRTLGLAHIRVVNAAVTRAPGLVSFHISADQSGTAEQSLHLDPEHQARSVVVQVPALTLADLSAPARPSTPALIKLDIEGAEGDAMQAVPSHWLGADAPFWIVEINPVALARFSAHPLEIVDRFPMEHFDCWLLPKHPHAGVASSRLRRITTADATDFTDSRYYNLLAIPRGARWQQRADSVEPLIAKASRTAS